MRFSFTLVCLVASSNALSISRLFNSDTTSSSLTHLEKRASADMLSSAGLDISRVRVPASSAKPAFHPATTVVTSIKKVTPKTLSQLQKDLSTALKSQQAYQDQAFAQISRMRSLLNTYTIKFENLPYGTSPAVSDSLFSKHQQLSYELRQAESDAIASNTVNAKIVADVRALVVKAGGVDGKQTFSQYAKSYLGYKPVVKVTRQF